MKKLFLAAFVAVASLTANAQIWVGGELGYNVERESNDGTTTYKDHEFTLAPEIGYKLNDKFDVAVALNFSHDDDEFREDGYTHTYSENSFSINPYIRYSFYKTGKFSAFVDGGFKYGFTHYCGDDENRINWGINVRPGIAYALTEKVGLVAHVGKVGWDYSKKDENKTNEFGFKVWNNISFGAYVNF